MTSYVVLRRDDSGNWRFAGPHQTANTPEAAIRATVDSNKTGARGNPSPNDVGGTAFVAVPARSWKPVTVSIETRTQLKLGPAESAAGEVA